MCVHLRGTTMNTARSAIVATLLLTLASCTHWVNPNIADPRAQERQLNIDKARCTAASTGAAPMPAINTTQAPSAYNMTGTANTLGTVGNQPFNATTSFTSTATPSPGSSFGQGFAQGAANGAAIRARQQQDEIFKGCMYSLGWSDNG